MKRFDDMSKSEQTECLNSLRVRREALRISLVTMGNYLGYTDGYMSRVERNKVNIRSGVITAIEKFLEDVEAGRIDVPRSVRVYPDLEQEPACKPESETTPPQKTRSFISWNLVMGLLRQSLWLKPEYVCNVMHIDKEELLFKEAGVSIMTAGEVARLLRFYSKHFTDTLAKMQSH